MTRSIPVLGYPSKSLAAVALREQGYKHREIAEAIGVAPSTVGNLLRYGRRATEVEDPFAYRTERLTRQQRAHLQGAARARRMPVRAFIDRLLAVIADEKMTDAILDDRSEPK